jgi:hypothetical protein
MAIGLLWPFDDGERGALKRFAPPLGRGAIGGALWSADL